MRSKGHSFPGERPTPGGASSRATVCSRSSRAFSSLPSSSSTSASTAHTVAVGPNCSAAIRAARSARAVSPCRASSRATSSNVPCIGHHSSSSRGSTTARMLGQQLGDAVEAFRRTGRPVGLDRRTQRRPRAAADRRAGCHSWPHHDRPGRASSPSCGNRPGRRRAAGHVPPPRVRRSSVAVRAPKPRAVRVCRPSPAPRRVPGPCHRGPADRAVRRAARSRWGSAPRRCATSARSVAGSTSALLAQRAQRAAAAANAQLLRQAWLDDARQPAERLVDAALFEAEARQLEVGVLHHVRIADRQRPAVARDLAEPFAAAPRDPGRPAPPTACRCRPSTASARMSRTRLFSSQTVNRLPSVNVTSSSRMRPIVVCSIGSSTRTNRSTSLRTTSRAGPNSASSSTMGSA